MANCEEHTIDSNVTGLRFAHEECRGRLPANPTWFQLEPNSYGDFGSTIQTIVRAPITDSRQRKKGIPVGLDASAAFNQDFTHEGTKQLLAGHMYSEFIGTEGGAVLTFGAGEVQIDINSEGEVRLVSTDAAIDFTDEDLGLIPGCWIFIGGDSVTSIFSKEVNNGFKRVRAVTLDSLVLDKSDQAMQMDEGTGKEIKIYLGRTIKNEVGAKIKKQPIQMERTLGFPDATLPNPQSEYLVGCEPSEMVISFAARDKVAIDFSYLSTDQEVRTQAEGLKPGTRPVLSEAEAYNTSSHLRRIRMAKAGVDEVAPEPLFGFATDLSLTVNNSLTSNNALGVMGSIGSSLGTFVVTATLEAYFSDVRAIQAVRNNEDITLDVIMAQNGKGFVFDMPLVTLGDGRPNVTLDQPIKLPLTSDAVSGAKVDPNLNHTLLVTVFDQLPAWAS